MSSLAKTSLLPERLFRILVGTRFLTKTPTGEYAHSKFSAGYTSFPGLYFSLMYAFFLSGSQTSCLLSLPRHDQFLAPMIRFSDYLKLTGPIEPTSLYNNPYTYAHNLSDSGKTTWDIMAMEHEKFATFQKGLGAMDAMCPVLGYYDFDQLADTTKDVPVLVDVGGGQGQSLVAILNAHKRIDPAKCVLQDRAPVLALAITAEVLPKEVQKMEIDFFVEQPVKGE
jgi:hypothetical protein